MLGRTPSGLSAFRLLFALLYFFEFVIDQSVDVFVLLGFIAHVSVSLKFINLFLLLLLILWDCFVRLVVKFLEEFICVLSLAVVILAFLDQLIFKKI